MQTVGHYLKKEREAKNISLREVFRTTRIPVRYLDSLEQDDFEKMPGDPYNKGYISSYAVFIGADKDEALKLYDSLLLENINNSHMQNDLPIVRNKRSYPMVSIDRKKKILMSLVIFIFMALGIYFIWPQIP